MVKKWHWHSLSQNNSAVPFGAVALQIHAHLSLSNTFICRTNWRSLGTFGYRWASYGNL